MLYNERRRKRRNHYMSKRPRRNHAPAFKTKVALEALKGDQAIVELSQLPLAENRQRHISTKFMKSAVAAKKCGAYSESRSPSHSSFKTFFICSHNLNGVLGQDQSARSDWNIKYVMPALFCFSSFLWSPWMADDASLSSFFLREGQMRG